MVINNYFECLAKPAKSAKLLHTAFFASLADLARTLKKFSYNYSSNYKLFCCIVHAKPAKLAKAVTYGLCGLGENLKNLINNYLW